MDRRGCDCPGPFCGREGGIDTAIKQRTVTLQPVHALAPLMGLQLWLIITHIPWRDELQAYLLVRDSAGVGGLFANLHYEGHPSLWYLLLGVIEAVVRSPAALKVAQVAIALTTTVLVWRRAPFPGWVKLLILAGYYLLFEYGVIARSYGLGALLLFAWLIWRRTIWGWVILALMANVAVHFALLSAFCVAAGLLVERRWSWAGAAIWGAGCLAAVVTIVPAHDATTGLDALAQPLSIRILDALRRQSATLYPALIGVWPLPLAGAGEPSGGGPSLARSWVSSPACWRPSPSGANPARACCPSASSWPSPP